MNGYIRHDFISTLLIFFNQTTLTKDIDYRPWLKILITVKIIFLEIDNRQLFFVSIDWIYQW